MGHPYFDKIVEYLEQSLERFPQLTHASNLLTKWEERTKKLSEKQVDALNDIITNYYSFLKINLETIGYSKTVIEKRVQLLNDYYNFLNTNNYDNVFTSQGKLRPTILEEFMYLLFKDYVKSLKQRYHDSTDVLDSGNAKSYTNMYFTSSSIEHFIESPNVEINVKDQDFAIYRNTTLSINNKKKNIKIPVIAVECKTYIDRTMLEGIIATAEKIKTGNPYTLFIVVSENYDVDLSVDPAYSRIDQIYVLRKCKRKEDWANISSKVVLRMFKEVTKHIERPWSDVENKMRNQGIII